MFQRQRLLESQNDKKAKAEGAPTTRSSERKPGNTHTNLFLVFCNIGHFG